MIPNTATKAILARITQSRPIIVLKHYDLCWLVSDWNKKPAFTKPLEILFNHVFPFVHKFIGLGFRQITNIDVKDTASHLSLQLMRESNPSFEDGISIFSFIDCMTCLGIDLPTRPFSRTS